MPATEAQLAANRANARHSTGPRTADGKRRVSRNAVTHGLGCQDVLQADEDGSAFATYRTSMIADNLPVGAQEQDCVERMVAAQWRSYRLLRTEREIREEQTRRMGIPANTGTVLLYDLNTERAFTTLDRRDTAYSREYLRWSRRLQELQAQRRKGLRHVLEDELDDGESTSPNASTETATAAARESSRSPDTLPVTNASAPQPPKFASQAPAVAPTPEPFRSAPTTPRDSTDWPIGKIAKQTQFPTLTGSGSVP